MEKVHARFVGLGVSQRQKRRQFEADGVSCVASLKETELQGQNRKTHSRTVIYDVSVGI